MPRSTCRNPVMICPLTTAIDDIRILGADSVLWLPWSTTWQGLLSQFPHTREVWFLSGAKSVWRGWYRFHRSPREFTHRLLYCLIHSSLFMNSTNTWIVWAAWWKQFYEVDADLERCNNDWSSQSSFLSSRNQTGRCSASSVIEGSRFSVA